MLQPQHSIDQPKNIALRHLKPPQRGAGYPDNAPAKRPKQARFEGSDRQVRGRIMALLRAAAGPVATEAALAAAHEGGVLDPKQPRRAYDSLIADGLMIEFEGAARLP